MLGKLAEMLGRLLRILVLGLRGSPGVVGPVLIVVGVAMIYPPAAWITAGAFLLAYDWRS